MQNIRQVQVARSIWAWPHHFTNTPHFKAYKCPIEGARASESVSSTRECRALSPSDIPEAATHEGSTTSGSGATPSRPPGIANPSWWGSARMVPPAVLSGLKLAPSLILHKTSGNIWIGGNVFSLAAGQRDVSASHSNGEWDREKSSGQSAFSLVANRSTSALP